MPTTNLDKPATESNEANAQPRQSDALNQRVKIQPIAVEPCQSAPSPSTSHCCGSKPQAVQLAGQINRHDAHEEQSPYEFLNPKQAEAAYQTSSCPIDAAAPKPGAEPDYKNLAAFNSHPTCSPHYKTLSFLIPFVAVSMMFACEQNCATTAIVAGLLAGCTSRIIYATIKRIRHRH